MDKVLPPLPPSNEESLARNTFNSQFGQGSRDFWGDNKLERITMDEPKKCDHDFIMNTDGVMCKKCHIGWVGKELESRDGKLYIHNQLINF